MKKGGVYLVTGVFGLLALCATVAAGYFQTKAPPRAKQLIAIGAPLSERQMLERRRANVGIVAVGGSTAQ